MLKRGKLVKLVANESLSERDFRDVRRMIELVKCWVVRPIVMMKW